MKKGNDGPPSPSSTRFTQLGETSLRDAVLHATNALSPFYPRLAKRPNPDFWHVGQGCHTNPVSVPEVLKELTIMLAEPDGGDHLVGVFGTYFLEYRL